MHAGIDEGGWNAHGSGNAVFSSSYKSEGNHCRTSEDLLRNSMECLACRNRMRSSPPFSSIIISRQMRNRELGRMVDANPKKGDRGSTERLA